MWHRGKRSVVALLLVAALAGSFAYADDWIRFAPPGERFAVAMPAPPTLRETETGTIVGRVATRVYSVDHGRERFRVTVIDLPRLAVWMTPDTSTYRRVRDRVLAGESATATTFQESTQSGVAGRLLKYRVDETNRTGRAELYLVGTRMHIFNLQHPVGPVADADRFFHSIILER
jgi:hypothetical protein